MPPSAETISAAQSLYKSLCEISPNPIKAIDHLIQKEACRDLPIGDFRVVKKSWDESETTIAHAYVLRRTAEDTHTLEFNLSFKDIQKSFLQPGDKSPTERELRARMSQCLQENEKYLLGPGGQKLKLKVLDPKSAGPEHRRLETLITIHHHENFRSHSRGYQKSASCMVFIHELLHLAGLADEYTETQDLDIRKYVCRARNYRPSIMGNHEEALQHVQSLAKPNYHRYTVRYCSCDPKTCPKDTDTQANACGPGEITNFGVLTADEPMKDLIKESQNKVSDFTSLLSSGFVTPQNSASKSRLRVVQVEKESVATLLRPAQFRAMVYPGCREKNRTYYRCTKAWAGQGWKEQLFGSAQNCPTLPPECETLNWTN